MLLYKAIQGSGYMKIWTKIHIKDRNKDIDKISNSLTNYLYGYGPILDITRKYDIDKKDIAYLNQYTANRIAGLLMLYLAKDNIRINDIVNKYNFDADIVKEIIPEIEGYINKESN